MNREKYIQDYFAGRLSETQKAEFTQKLEQDDELRSAFNEYRDIQQASILSEKNAFKKQLIDLEKKKEQNSSSKIYILGLVAAAAVFLGAIVFWPEKNGPDYFEDYFESFPNVYQPVVRSSNSNETTFIAYENEDYERAVQLFEEKLSQNDNPNLRFYKALSLIELDKHDSAARELDKVITTDFEYKIEAQWYRALLFLHQERTADALSLLQSIKKSDPKFKSDQVQNLIKELE